MRFFPWLLILGLGCFLFSSQLATVVFAAELQASIQISPLILEYHLLPGQNQKGLLVFFNPSAVPQMVTPKIFDFAPADEVGGLRFFEDPGWQFSASRWILFNQEPFELGPEEEKGLPFTVLVPDEGQPGSHFAAIFGEAKPIKEEEREEEVKVKVRVGAGTLFLVNVPDLRQEPDSYRGHVVSFEIRGLAPIGKWLESMVKTPVGLVKDQPLAFIARFKNTGNFYQRPAGEIEIFDLWGKKIGEMSLKKQRVLPEATIQFKADWQPSFLFGPYQARLKFYYGPENNLLIEEDLGFVAFSAWLLVLMPSVGFLILGIFFYLKKKIAP